MHCEQFDEIAQRAGVDPSVLVGRFVGCIGEAAQHGAAVARDEYVIGAQVSVGDSDLVQVGDRARERGGKPERRKGIGGWRLGQCGAVDGGEGEAREAVVVDELGDRHDPRVPRPPEQLGLSAEPTTTRLMGRGLDDRRVHRLKDIEMISKCQGVVICAWLEPDDLRAVSEERAPRPR